MTQAIIYKQDNGVLAIIYPTPEALAIHGIDAIAKKDVPVGKRYKLIDSSELPTDTSMRNAWTIDDSELTDGVGAPGNTFEEIQND